MARVYAVVFISDDRCFQLMHLSSRLSKISLDDFHAS